MKCVVDTSAVSWLERIDGLNLLELIYEEIYAPESVFQQLKDHYPTKNFIEKSLNSINILVPLLDHQAFQDLYDQQCNPQLPEL